VSGAAGSFGSRKDGPGGQQQQQQQQQQLPRHLLAAGVWSMQP